MLKDIKTKSIHSTKLKRRGKVVMAKCPKDGKDCDIKMGIVYEYCRHGLPAVGSTKTGGRLCPIYDEVAIERIKLDKEVNMQIIVDSPEWNYWGGNFTSPERDVISVGETCFSSVSEVFKSMKLDLALLPKRRLDKEQWRKLAMTIHKTICYIRCYKERHAEESYIYGTGLPIEYSENTKQ